MFIVNNNHNICVTC